MASLAGGARRRLREPRDGAERLPRPRSAELDSQLRSICTRRRTRLARARDCRSIRRSKGQVRLMITRTNTTTNTPRHKEDRLAVVLPTSLKAGAAAVFLVVTASNG